MIHPFAGYTMRAAIWYQGEGNARPGAVPYDQTLPLMIRDWRSRWDDDFSFYFVQLANYRQPSTDPGNNDPWPLLQGRMRRILETTPKIGMAVTNDIGEADDIHPRNKKDVGERLALWALESTHQAAAISKLCVSASLREDISGPIQAPTGKHSFVDQPLIAGRLRGRMSGKHGSTPP